MSNSMDRLAEALNEIISKEIEEQLADQGEAHVEVDNVEGFDDAVEEAIESYLQSNDFDVEAENVLNLDRAIENALDDARFSVEQIDGLDDIYSLLETYLTETPEALLPHLEKLLHRPSVQQLLLSALWNSLKEKISRPFRSSFSFLREKSRRIWQSIRKLFFFRKKDPVFDAEGKLLVPEDTLPDPEPSEAIKRILGL